MYKVIVVGTDPESRMGGIAFAISGFLSTMKFAGIKHEFVPTHHASVRGGKSWLWLIGILKIIREIKAIKSQGNLPIVYFHAGAGVSLFRGSITLKVARFYGAKTILQLHALEVGDYLTGKYKYKLFASAISSVDIISVLTPWWKSQLIKAGVKNRITVVPNSLSVDWEEKTKLPRKYNDIAEKKSVSVLSMARIEDGKGVDLVIKAMQFMPEYVQLTVAGDGNLLESLKIMTKNLVLNERVLFTGWVADTEKQKLIEQADIYCLPTTYDSFGMGFLELMANGVPVVALKWGAISDVVKHGYSGLLIEHKDAKALANAIECLLDVGMRQRMGKQAQQWVVDEFGAKKVGKLLLNMFEEVLVKEVIK